MHRNAPVANVSTRHIELMDLVRRIESYIETTEQEIRGARSRADAAEYAHIKLRKLIEYKLGKLRIAHADLDNARRKLAGTP